VELAGWGRRKATLLHQEKVPAVPEEPVVKEPEQLELFPDYHPKKRRD
jgi:hypothetical protein